MQVDQGSGYSFMRIRALHQETKRRGMVRMEQSLNCFIPLDSPRFLCRKVFFFKAKETVSFPAWLFVSWSLQIEACFILNMCEAGFHLCSVLSRKKE